LANEAPYGQQHKKAITMKKPIIKHLCMTTMIMGMTLATTAMASGHKESSKNGLLCVTIEGTAPLKSALAVLRVEKNGQAQGALCYLGSLLDNELGDCHVVDGRVLKVPGAVSASYVGLVGTGIDNDLLIQNDVSISFASDSIIGKGSAAQFHVANPVHDVLNDTGVTNAYQGVCTLDSQSHQSTALKAPSLVSLRQAPTIPASINLPTLMASFSLNPSQQSRYVRCERSIAININTVQSAEKLLAGCLIYALTGKLI
jgi:hypothetical protein